MPLLVSSIGLRNTIDLGAMHGAPIELILRRLGLKEADIRDPLQRMPWDTLIALMEEVANALGGHQAFRRAAEDFIKVVPDFVPLARSLVKPKPMMEFVFGVVDPVVYPMIDHTLNDLGNNRFALEAVLRPDYRAAEVFWAASAGAIAAMPGYLGIRQLAKVSGEWTSHSASYRIQFPKSTTSEAAPATDGHEAMLEFIRRMGLELVQNLTRADELDGRFRESTRALESVIEQLVAEVPNAAFIVELGAAVRAANGAGKELFRQKPDVLTRELFDAIAENLRVAAGNDEMRYAVTHLLDDRYLVIRRGATNEIERRLQRAALKWKLTRRQEEVLALIVRGSANKDIATTIGCAARTVEIHLSRMYEKAGTDSRLALLARFWSPDL